MLAHDGRFERPITIPRDLDIDRADIGDHGLGSFPVARVGSVTALDRVFGISDMAIHLTLETGLQHSLGQIAQQTARASQFHPLSLGSIVELLGELRVNHRNTRCIGHRSGEP